MTQGHGREEHGESPFEKPGCVHDIILVVVETEPAPAGQGLGSCDPPSRHKLASLQVVGEVTMLGAVYGPRQGGPGAQVRKVAGTAEKWRFGAQGRVAQ